MKIKRITKVETFQHYKDDLEKMMNTYLSKSKSLDTPKEVLESVMLGCHNPLVYSCVVENEKGPVGFVVAMVILGTEKRKVCMDHFYTSGLGNKARVVYSTVVNRICKDMKVDKSDVYFITYRDPASWVRFSKKEGEPMEIAGWILRRAKED